MKLWSSFDLYVLFGRKFVRFVERSRKRRWSFSESFSLFGRFFAVIWSPWQPNTQHLASIYFIIHFLLAVLRERFNVDIKKTHNKSRVWARSSEMNSGLELATFRDENSSWYSIGFTHYSMIYMLILAWNNIFLMWMLV